MSIKTAVLCSGSGTNLAALIKARDGGALSACELALVVCDRPAKATEIAETAGIKAVTLDRKSDDFEAQLLKILAENEIEFIVLAGFLSILSSNFIKSYRNRIINVHPSLIPSFCGKGYYGLRVHEAALKKGVKVSGATVHFVNATPDGGKIIAQKAVSVRENDTPSSLQKRIMKQAEWVLLPQATESVCRELDGKKSK